MLFRSIDITGSGNNTVRLSLTNVLQMTGDNVYNTGNGYAAVSGSVPTGWGAINAWEQVLVDGNAGDTAYLQGAWSVAGLVAKGGVNYKVVQHATAQAQVLVNDAIDLRLTPTINTGFGEWVGGINYTEAASNGGTVIRVALLNTGATAGQQVRLSMGSATPILSAVLTSNDLSNGYVDITVPTATLTGAGEIERAHV